MKVLVTGASGFLGRAAVATALAAGHDVLALRRPAAKVPAKARGLTWIEGDLRQPDRLSAAFAEVEGVIHCAASATGDLPTQLAGTLLATENLLATLPLDVQRIVHVSSFSVYDFDDPPFSGELSEDTLLETRPLRRDAYTQTKLLQERLVREFGERRQIPTVIARPGAIYGVGHTWDYGSSLSIGRFDLIFSPLARMRLIHVTNCADALIAALTAPVQRELIVNLVDAEQPSHWRFHRLSRQAGAPTGMGVPVPYAGVLALGAAARAASWLCFRGRARMPELLDPPRQRARWRPLHYARCRAQKVLGVRQQISLESGIAGMLPQTETANPRVNSNRSA
jgi:2-alkyl-3-oxoalkanoate reductase